MSKPSPVNPVAGHVRTFFRDNPSRMARLSPEAQATLAPGSRGRLHPEAITDYNRNRKPERQYVLGVGKANKAAAVATRKSLVEQGLAGKRGPLSAAAKEALAQPKG